MKLDVLLLFSIISTAVGGAPQTITGFRGERVGIRCSYRSRYESNSKFFCKGECEYGNKIIMVKSGSSANDERFSLTDDTTARVFTVTITDLRTEDAGIYWCVVERSLPLRDVYSEIILLVKQDNKTTEVSTISSFSKSTSSYFSTSEPNLQTTSINRTDRHDNYGPVIYIYVGLVFIIIIFLMALIVLFKQRSKKSSRVTQSGLSQHVAVGLLPLNTRAETTAEDIDWSDHNYQEISEFKCKNTATIYTTADNPDSMIYSTADNPDSTLVKPDSTIYSTVANPDSTLVEPVSTIYIYSTADNPVSTIYSTADKPDSTLVKPDSTIYSTVANPDSTLVEPVSTIYSTADKPNDPIIFPTAKRS